MNNNRFIKKRLKKLGTPPGTLIDYGEETYKSKIFYLKINGAETSYVEEVDLKECFPLKPDAFHWINITGSHRTQYVQELGKSLKIHQLFLEDILSPGQRPKCESFESYLFIVLQMLSFNKDTKQVQEHQASFILGSNFLISFFEESPPFLKPIVEHLIQGVGKTPRLGMDYLAYLLMDHIVDHYFYVIDAIAQQMNSLEEKIISQPDDKIIALLHNLKKEMVILRKAVWPLREVIMQIQRQETGLIDDETMLYFKDIYDHTIQVIDTIESLKDIMGSMIYIYMSSTTNKMNDIIKILTVVSTIFVPLTFITSIYGMNFDYMPELHSPYGYIAVWAVMMLIALGMVVFFRRKRWF